MIRTGFAMRTVLFAAVTLIASSAWAQDAAVQPTDSSSASSVAGPAGVTANVSRSQLVSAYPDRLADRKIAIGQGLFEVGVQGGYQFNAAQGLGEVPDMRYGLTDQFEVTLLGARYIVTEDARYVPGFAVRAQLHDLAYQVQSANTLKYPVLRPGGFLEVRDRLPYHLAVNGTIGYVVSIQADTGLQTSQRVANGYAPMQLELQWSPLELVSFALKGGYNEDTSVPAYEGPTQSDGTLQVAAIFNSSRFDVRVYFQNNWFGTPAIGYVPELGASVAFRL